MQQPNAAEGKGLNGRITTRGDEFTRRELDAKSRD